MQLRKLKGAKTCKKYQLRMSLQKKSPHSNNSNSSNNYKDYDSNNARVFLLLMAN